MVATRIIRSLTGLILGYAATEPPLTIYLLRAFFAQIPSALEEAARSSSTSFSSRGSSRA